MSLAPIVLFVYNRPEHTRKTLESLMLNDLASQSDLYIYADGPKEETSKEALQKIADVRKVIREKQWCKNVHIFESAVNRSLPVTLVEKVTEILNRFEKIIVLEDDLVLSKGFLRYMNEALDIYRDEEKVMHISGYMFPTTRKLPETFFLILATCWGWATWKRAWNLFDPSAENLLGKIKENEIADFDMGYPHYEALKRCSVSTFKSWDIRWYGSVFVNKGLCLHPNISLVKNIGHDNSGQHCKESEIYSNQKVADNITVTAIPLKESNEALEAIISFLGNSNKKTNFISKVKNRVVNLKQMIVADNGKTITQAGLNSKNVSDEESANKYWEKNIDLLETWGHEHVWNEIQMLISGLEGKVLDIACGSGVVIDILKKYNKLDVYGCDIAPVVIDKCINRGISRDKLIVCDATDMSTYKNSFFDYSYSIGSIEYFTKEGIESFVRENARITAKMSFHMLPVSKNGIDEGWVNYSNSGFYNNSVGWWESLFQAKFSKVYSINSCWKNEISIGKWFVCIK